MPDIARDALARVDLFAGLSPRNLKKLAAVSRETTHRPGSEVAAEGRGALAFHAIVEGAATVTVGGRQVRTLGPGDYFGEISLIDGEPRSATVTVTGDGPLHTVAIGKTPFSTLIESEPSIAKALLVRLCGRLRAVEASR
ncbi:cyclic nucleotide-binding domain-containing protein [Jatrophihabitans sp. YIM 134969]